MAMMDTGGKAMTMDTAMAIEFTLTRATANQIGGDPDSLIPLRRFRVVTPGILAGDSVVAYVRDSNEMGEEVWLPLEQHGARVGTLTVWRRVAVVIAIHMLIARLRDGIKLGFDGGCSRIVEMPNGGTLIDLGEV